jgi:hypothetical protein
MDGDQGFAFAHEAHSSKEQEMFQISLQGYGLTVGLNHGLTLGNPRAPVLDIVVERLPQDSPRYWWPDVKTAHRYLDGKRVLTIDSLWMNRRWIVDVVMRATRSSTAT